MADQAQVMQEVHGIRLGAQCFLEMIESSVELPRAQGSLSQFAWTGWRTVIP
jgi:hypothetical protein